MLKIPQLLVSFVWCCLWFVPAIGLWVLASLYAELNKVFVTPVKPSHVVGNVETGMVSDK